MLNSASFEFMKPHKVVINGIQPPFSSLLISAPVFELKRLAFKRQRLLIIFFKQENLPSLQTQPQN